VLASCGKSVSFVAETGHYNGLPSVLEACLNRLVCLGEPSQESFFRTPARQGSLMLRDLTSLQQHHAQYKTLSCFRCVLLSGSPTH
jgi:hypothetical protein